MASSRLSEGDIARVRFVDGEPTLDGQPVSLSEIRGSKFSHIAEARIKGYEEGRENKYSGNTTTNRRLGNLRFALATTVRQQEKAKFKTGFADLQEKVRRSAQPGLFDRTWIRLENRFPKVMGAIGKALDFIGG